MWRFSELLSNGSQICLKTSEITSTPFRISSKFEMTIHAEECKFGGYGLIIMNLPVNANLSDTVETKRQLKARIKSTLLNLQTATSRVHFVSTEG